MSEDTSSIDDLINSCYGKYENGYLSEVESLLQSIPNQTTFHRISKIKHDIMQAYLLSIKGEYDDSERLASNALQESIKTRLFIYALDAYLVLMEASERLEKYDELADLNQKGELLLKKIENKNDGRFLHRKIWLLYYNGRSNWWHGNDINAQQKFEEGLDIAKKIQNKYDIGVCSRNVALVIEGKEKEKSKNLQLEALQIFREINNPLHLAWSLQNYAVFLNGFREYDQSMICLKESLEIREKFGNKKWLYWTLVNIAGLYDFLDKPEKSLEYIQKYYEIGKELGSKMIIRKSYYDRMSIYLELGDLDKAEYFFKKIDELPKIIDENNWTKIYFYYKSILSRMKGQIPDALKFMNKTIDMALEDENFRDIERLTYGYLYNIIYSLELKDQELANSNLKRIKDLLDETTDKMLYTNLEQNFKLGEAMILKNSLRIRDKAKAQEFFESCIEDNKFTAWHKNQAMINLCDLYLDELSTYGDSRTLTDLNNLVTKLQKRATNKNSFYLMIKIMIIQAKLALVEGKIQKAEGFFTEALTLSKEKGLTLLENEIKEEQDQITEWHQVSKDTSIQERLQKVQLANYIKEAEKYIGIRKMDIN